MRPWRETIDVSAEFGDVPLSFEQRRDAIAARLKSSAWHRRRPTLALLVGELELAVDEGEFDEWWDQIYDLADEDRVWINTFERSS